MQNINCPKDQDIDTWAKSEVENGKQVDSYWSILEVCEIEMVGQNGNAGGWLLEPSLC